MCCLLQASTGEPVSLQNVSKGRVPYCFTRLMGSTSVNEQILVGHKVSSSTLNCVSSLSEVFNHTRYTANMSASLKAMAVPGSMVYDDSCQVAQSTDELLELEQQLLQEERNAREYVEEIQGLWKDVVSQKIYSQAWNLANGIIVTLPFIACCVEPGRNVSSCLVSLVTCCCSIAAVFSYMLAICILWLFFMHVNTQ